MKTQDLNLKVTGVIMGVNQAMDLAESAMTPEMIAARREITRHKPGRHCACCGHTLSIYNRSRICQPCRQGFKIPKTNSAANF